MPAGERCRRAVCGRTARTVRCGGGRQPRPVGQPVRPRKPPADPTIRSFPATRLARSRGTSTRCDEPAAPDACFARTKQASAQYRSALSEVVHSDLLWQASPDARMCLRLSGNPAAAFRSCRFWWRCERGSSVHRHDVDDARAVGRTASGRVKNRSTTRSARYSQSLSSLCRHTTKQRRPPGTSACRTLRSATTGLAKNIVPKREKAWSKPSSKCVPGRRRRGSARSQSRPARLRRSPSR